MYLTPSPSVGWPPGLRGKALLFYLKVSAELMGKISALRGLQPWSRPHVSVPFLGVKSTGKREFWCKLELSVPFQSGWHLQLSSSVLAPPGSRQPRVPLPAVSKEQCSAHTQLVKASGCSLTSGKWELFQERN